LIFVLTRSLPGSALSAQRGADTTKEAEERFRLTYGLDQPLWRQYGQWLGGVLHGNFGNSLVSGQPASTSLRTGLAVTIPLSLFAMVIAGGLGFLVGILAAVKRGSKVDYVLSTFSFLGLSFPTFFLGLLLLLLFALRLGWFPVLGISGDSIDMFRRPIDSLRVLMLPALTIGLINAATISRMVRASLLETLRQPYVLAARARGSFESVIIMRHGLRNALIPTIAVLGLTFGQLLAGMVIVEQVFTLPGLGRTLVDAVRQRDYPVVQVTVLFFAVAFAVVNLMTDALYTVADPRVRLEG